MARLEAAGHGRRAETLARAFAKELQRPGELALLAGRAERAGDHNLALYIGKNAFARGADVAALAFPIGVIPAGDAIAGSGKRSEERRVGEGWVGTGSFRRTRCP